MKRNIGSNFGKSMKIFNALRPKPRVGIFKIYIRGKLPKKFSPLFSAWKFINKLSGVG